MKPDYASAVRHRIGRFIRLNRKPHERSRRVAVRPKRIEQEARHEQYGGGAPRTWGTKKGAPAGD